MRKLYTLIFLLLTLNSLAQDTAAKTIPPPPPPMTINIDDAIFTKVEVEATVDVNSWKSHLEKNLLPVLRKAIRKGLSPGVYVVQVRFLIGRDGSISEATALNDPGFGLAEGAVKILREGPKWTPGMQNGQKVRSYRTQPVTFQVTRE